MARGRDRLQTFNNTKGRQMRKTKRVAMPGRGRSSRNDAVAVPPEPVPSVPALISVARSSVLGPIWEPPALPVPRPSLPARAIAEISRPIAEPPQLPTVPLPALSPPRVSCATVETNAGVWVPPDPAMPRFRPRVVFCIDRTASRQDSFKPAKRLTDAVLGALPGELELSLASFGGEEVTFSPWTIDPARVRKVAAGLRCKAGYTQLLKVLRGVLEIDAVRCVVHVGDMFEEDAHAAADMAAELARRGIRVIVLHDTSLRGANFSPEAHDDARAVFQMLAQRTGGVLLPFDITALEELAKLMEALAVLTVGGTEMLKEQEPVMPAARELLRLLPPPRH
jgi:hypothetical protein